MRKIFAYKQFDSSDCGLVCLRIVLRSYGYRLDMQSIRSRFASLKEGVSLQDICDAANKLGFDCKGARVDLSKLQIFSPCILYWDKNHYVVCYRVKRKRGNDVYYIIDPAFGRYKLAKEELLRHWDGICLILKPHNNNLKNGATRSGLGYFRYLLPYKLPITQIILCYLVASLIQLLFPFFTQTLVDVGVGEKNINFVLLILASQILICVTQFGANMFNSWLSLHLSARVNLSIESDCLWQILRLPISFYATKKEGDLLQRIGDNRRIESLLMGMPLFLFFSVFNFVIFSSILAYYNRSILFIFIIGHILNILITIYFLRFRKTLDYQRFYLMSKNQNSLIQMVSAVSDIKLANCEKEEKWKWERLQIDLFKTSMRGLTISQYQGAISVLIIQITNVLMTYQSAMSVIDGKISLGMMVSISYIIGQLTTPMSQIIKTIQALQDAKISLERLNEVHCCPDEYEKEGTTMFVGNLANRDLSVVNLSFRYDQRSNFVLKNLTASIKAGQTTAIVGKSGCGKTTLLKLLIGFYCPEAGQILVGEKDLSSIDMQLWRSKIGCVLQDGFIFSGTIAYNITVSLEDSIDKHRFKEAVRVACLEEFIDSLPQKEQTKIGFEGLGISQGQKQRILLARVVYKNPDFVFFDEATNALDIENENAIMSNLKRCFSQKTMILVSHRLNVIKNADRIIVLNDGRVVEEGTHDFLMHAKGRYFELIEDEKDER